MKKQKNIFKLLIPIIPIIFLTGCATILPMYKAYKTPGFESTPLNELAKVSAEIDALNIFFYIDAIDGKTVDMYSGKYFSAGKHILKFAVKNTGASILGAIVGGAGISSYEEDLKKLEFEINVEPGEKYVVHLTSSEDKNYNAKIVFYNARYKKLSFTSTYPKDNVIKTVYIGKQ